MKTESTPPVLQALVLADHIYTEEGGKRIICGTFSQIFCGQFPTVFSRPTWAFILLADVIGEIELQLRFVHLEDGKILMQSAPIKVRSIDKLTPLDLAIEIPHFPLPVAGVYTFECYANRYMIGSVRLNVAPATFQENRND